MDKDWANSKLTFEDEQWAFRNSEKAIDKIWKEKLKIVSAETKKQLIELENVVKHMLMIHTYMDGWKDGKIS